MPRAPRQLGRARRGFQGEGCLLRRNEAGLNDNDDAARACPADDQEVRHPALRVLLLGLGWAAVALALAGVFLPILPTTPFLLVAAWAFAKSSRRMRIWLYEHPRFGQFLQDWRADGAIPLRGKLAAVGGMLLAWHIVFFTAERPWVPAAVGACLALVAVYVVTRPAPRRRDAAAE